jgi:hypothetical protein
MVPDDTRGARSSPRRLGAICSHLRGPPPAVGLALPSARAVAAAAGPLRAHTRSDDPPGADAPGLTAAEISFFQTNGYLVKRRLIPADELLPFVDMFWDTLRGPFDRAAPASFVDAGSKWDNARTQGSGYGEGARTAGGLPTTRELDDYRPNNVRKMGGLGKDPGFVAATSAHPAVLRTVHSLLGGQLKKPDSNRGMYSIFPSSEHGSGQLGPHHDNNPFDLGGVIYCSDVANPKSGGYTVWPGSHQLLYRGLSDEVNFQPNGERSPTTPPVAKNAHTRLLQPAH